ncbi:hypothetical protein V6574_28815 [Streptomyces sp. SM1P]
MNLPPLPVDELVPDEELRAALGLDGLTGRLPRTSPPASGNGSGWERC